MTRIRISSTVHFLVVSFVGAAAVFMLAMALSGCAEGPTESCLRYGFQPHTDAYATCLMTLDRD